MIRWTYNYFTKLPPIPSTYIDGCLYVLIAVFGALLTTIGSDEAAKWVAPVWLFWLRTTASVMLAAVTALKMYRSTGFADHIEQKKTEAETVFINKPPQP